MEQPPFRPTLALLAVLALAAPARAGSDQIPVKDAVAKMDKMRQSLIDGMIANMGLRADRNPEVAKLLKSGELQQSAKFFVGHVHDDVVRQIKNGAAGGQISALEVDNYAKSFKAELFAIRDTMQKETLSGEEFNSLLAHDKWVKILADTSDSRGGIVKENEDPKSPRPGPIPITDQMLVQACTNLGVGSSPKQPGNAPAPTGGSITPPQAPAPPGNVAAANPGSPASGASENTSSPAPASPASGASPDPAPGGSAADSAGAHLAFGDLTGAQRDLDQAAKNGSADANAYALRGELAMNDGRFSSALDDAKRALQMDPKNQSAIATLHFSEGRADGAAPDQSGASAGGKNAAAATLGGSAGAGYASAGSPGGGAAEGGAASAGGPSTTGLSRLSSEEARKKAEGALGMNDLAAARAYVNRALSADPSNPSLLDFRAAISARGHDYARAEAEATAGLALAPKDSTLLRTLGYAQLRDKDYRGALASANGLLERDPADAYAYALRAHAYGSMGDRDAMMADLKRAAELDPRFREAAAKLDGQTQLPKDEDILFLFPGENAAASATAAAPPAAEGRRGLILGASAAGGLILAFGLLHLLRKKAPQVEDDVLNDEETPAGPA